MLLPEVNKHGEPREYVATEKTGGPNKKRPSSSSPRRRYTTTGINYQRGLKEYYQRKKAEYLAQHGPVRIIYTKGETQ